MKTLKLIIAGFALIIAGSLQAQVSVNVNIGGRPDWAPVAYSEANYYYLPDIESYYDVRQSNFIYLNNGAWVSHRSLPQRYRNYDLYNGYKVVIRENGPRPYTHFKQHKIKYYRGHRAPQRVVVRDYHHNDHKSYKKHKAKKHHNKHHHDD